MPSKGRESQLSLYGPFALTQSQKYSVDVLSELIETLLRENNLFDLHEVLNTKTGCDSLIVVIKNKLEKEFTTLQFPDPIRKSEFSPVGFLSKKEYARRAKDDTDRSRVGRDREIYCHAFAVFIIRLTLLLSAVIASVSYQRNVFKKLLNQEAVGVSATENKSYKSIADTNITFSPVQSDIITLLKSGSLQQIPNDPRRLFVFNKADPIVIDVDKGIVYNAQTSPTGTLGIKINRQQVPVAPVFGAAPAYGYAAPPVYGYAPPTPIYGLRCTELWSASASAPAPASVPTTTAGIYSSTTSTCTSTSASASACACASRRPFQSSRASKAAYYWFINNEISVFWK